MWRERSLFQQHRRCVCFKNADSLSPNVWVASPDFSQVCVVLCLQHHFLSIKQFCGYLWSRRFKGFFTRVFLSPCTWVCRRWRDGHSPGITFFLGKTQLGQWRSLSECQSQQLKACRDEESALQLPSPLSEGTSGQCGQSAQLNSGALRNQPIFNYTIYTQMHSPSKQLK